MGQRQPFQQKPLGSDRFLGSAVTTICCARAPLGPGRPGCGGGAQAWRRWRHMTRSEEVEEDCCDTIDLNASCV